jgi:hypothetical protein
MGSPRRKSTLASSGSLSRQASQRERRSSSSLGDVLQDDVIDKFLGRKEGKETFTSVPRWNISVNGRKFNKYVTLSKREPRRSLLLLPVADPRGLFASFVAHTNMITDLVYTSYMVALSMAFNDYSSINAWTVLDLTGSCIYVLDIIAEFHIGFMVRWDSEYVIIKDGLEVFKFYLTKSTFFLDFLASLPIILQILFVAQPSYGSNTTAVRLLQLLRLLRLLRVANLIRTMGKVGQGGSLGTWLATKVSSLTIFMLRILFTFTVLLNLMACLWWWIAVTEGGENSWVLPLSEAKPELNIYNPDEYNSTGGLTTDQGGAWLVCAYYVLVTMSTIGYGDITPVTYAEIGLAMIFMVIGVSYFGYVISSVSELVQMSKNAEMDSAELLEKLRGLEVWMNQNGFKKKIKQEIRQFFNTAYTPTSDTNKESEYFDVLPLWLRTKVLKSIMSNSEALEQFTGIRLHPLSRIAKVVVRAISASAIPVHIRTGEIVFSRGDDADHVFLLEEGEIGTLTEGDSEPFVVMAPGVLGTSSVFGEKIPLCKTRPLTTFALTPATVWRLDGKDIYNRLLAWAPISLVHILDNYLEGLERYKKYYDERISQGYYIERSSMDTMFDQVKKEALELREHLVEASEKHFQKDIERGFIEENSIDHRSFYKILNRDTAQENELSDDDGDDEAPRPILGMFSPGSFKVFQGLKPMNSLLRRRRDGAGSNGLEGVSPREEEDSLTNRRLI